MIDIVKFKKVSIRGRLAYALKCLDVFLKFKKVDVNKEIINQLNLFWSINTSIVDISEMEIKLNEMSPTSILGDEYDDNFEYISFEEYLNLKSFYSNQDGDTLRLFYFLSEIVFSNLYSEIGAYGKNSYSYFEKFINICAKNEIEFPQYENILLSKFINNYGWGNLRDMNFWQNNI